jgi:hypothetical protein
MQSIQYREYNPLDTMHIHNAYNTMHKFQGIDTMHRFNAYNTMQMQSIELNAFIVLHLNSYRS